MRGAPGETDMRQVMPLQWSDDFKPLVRIDGDRESLPLPELDTK